MPAQLMTVPIVFTLDCGAHHSGRAGRTCLDIKAGAVSRRLRSNCFCLVGPLVRDASSNILPPSPMAQRRIEEGGVAMVHRLAGLATRVAGWHKKCYPPCPVGRIAHVADEVSAPLSLHFERMVGSGEQVLGCGGFVKGPSLMSGEPTCRVEGFPYLP